MDAVPMTAPPPAGELPLFDMDEREQWEIYKELNSEALDADIDLIRMTAPEEFADEAVEAYWRDARQSHRQELWTAGWKCLVGRNPTFGSRDGEIEDLAAQNDALRSELEDSRLKVVELESEIRRLNAEGDKQYENVRRLEAELSNHQSPRVCGCGRLTYVVWCPHCGEEWDTVGG